MRGSGICFMPSAISFALSLLGVLLFALSYSAQAQQPTKVSRIGYLTVAPLSANVARVEAFRQGLRELGYVEGKTSSSSGDREMASSEAKTNL
jgi:putative ABC transport system substrate-binding protein